MKYLGKITDKKDLVTKEYVDTSVETKQDKLIAGANITIAEDGRTISSTGSGTSESDVFVLNLNVDDSGNVTSASHTYEETKTAIEGNKIIMMDAGLGAHNVAQGGFSAGNDIFFIIYNLPYVMQVVWKKGSDNLGTLERLIAFQPFVEANQMDTGYLFWSNADGWVTKEIPSFPTYTAGNGIAISSDNVISIVAPKVYSGADAPADTLGNNGDIYIQTSEA